MLKKIIIILIVILAVGWLFWNNLNAPADKNGREQAFTISKGETIKQIADNLGKANLIKSPVYFRYLIWRRDLKILAGEYRISSNLKTGEIITMLAGGRVVNQEKTITIIEGWKIKDIDEYLGKNNILPLGDFAKSANRAIGQLEARPDFLAGAPVKANLEGYLFPDTYKIAPDATVEEIINKMLVNFNKKLTPKMRSDILAQKKTIYEIITLASLLEKEVRTAADMKIVSGIFWDRIKFGMPLQADSTLSYIFNDKIGGHTVEQTKVDSPYNTYKYRGLPPGPIANPGLNAITAAIYPAATDYVYFLSDPATGQTIFSKNLAEHNKNKVKYLK